MRQRAGPVTADIGSDLQRSLRISGVVGNGSVPVLIERGSLTHAQLNRIHQSDRVHITLNEAVGVLIGSFDHGALHGIAAHRLCSVQDLCIPRSPDFHVKLIVFFLQKRCDIELKGFKIPRVFANQRTIQKDFAIVIGGAKAQQCCCTIQITGIKPAMIPPGRLVEAAQFPTIVRMLAEQHLKRCQPRNRFECRQKMIADIQPKIALVNAEFFAQIMDILHDGPIH